MDHIALYIQNFHILICNLAYFYFQCTYCEQCLIFSSLIYTYVYNIYGKYLLVLFYIVYFVQFYIYHIFCFHIILITLHIVHKQILKMKYKYKITM